MKKDITIPLRQTPEDVNLLIREEQLRIELQEKQRLKKEHVVFRMLREWKNKRDKEVTISGEALREALKRTNTK